MKLPPELIPIFQALATGVDITIQYRSKLPLRDGAHWSDKVDHNWNTDVLSLNTVDYHYRIKPKQVTYRLYAYKTKDTTGKSWTTFRVIMGPFFNLATKEQETESIALIHEWENDEYTINYNNNI